MEKEDITDLVEHDIPEQYRDREYPPAIQAMIDWSEYEPEGKDGEDW